MISAQAGIGVCGVELEEAWHSAACPVCVCARVCIYVSHWQLILLDFDVVGSDIHIISSGLLLLNTNRYHS